MHTKGNPMLKLPNAVKIGALSLSLIVLSAVIVEAINIHYFENYLIIKNDNRKGANWIVDNEMRLWGGEFIYRINGKTILASATRDRNGYMVKAMYRQNGKTSQPFYEQNVIINTWSPGPNNTTANALTIGWRESFEMSWKFLIHQLRVEF
ncbi:MULTISPECIES: hypothetical protein [Acidithiobacillus]|uniref:hypothetical protein n=1 Tax=Acidithiobacillus TaxID=119977 RepID=UPI000B086888|nr:MULTISPECIES: hypothetical protein [Acidithiobacillus]MDD2750505.1 hypothetical protein [Acidithiobacillus sp.]MDD5278761.1 hypothetical protein [Acidithiobacillus sp.]